jgi:cytochrome P450
MTTEAATFTAPDHVPPDRVVDFDMYHPPGVEKGFHAAWKKLQDEAVGDIVWTPRNGGHWILTRGRAIHDVFADYQRFSNKCILVPKEVGEKHTLLPTTIDPPEHRPYRMLLNSGLTPAAVRRIEGSIRQLAGSLIEQVRAEGRCNFTTAYAEKLPIHIFLMLVDLPVEDAPKLKYWADQMTRPDGSMPFEDATRAFYDYLDPVVDRLRERPGDDMLSHLVNGEVDGRKVTKDEALALSAQVLIAGLDTVVNFLSFAMLFLARNPDHRQELVDNPELMPKAVEELFRRFPLVTIGRLVKEDTRFDGVSLRAGDMVIVPTELHGLDERENRCPMDVDFHREDISHSTFGYGPHRCPGMHLARAELAVTLEEWLSRIPDFQVAPDADITYRGGLVGCIDALPLVWSTEKPRAVPLAGGADQGTA